MGGEVRICIGVSLACLRWDCSSVTLRRRDNHAGACCITHIHTHTHTHTHTTTQTHLHDSHTHIQNTHTHTHTHTHSTLEQGTIKRTLSKASFFGGDGGGAAGTTSSSEEDVSRAAWSRLC